MGKRHLEEYRRSLRQAIDSRLAEGSSDLPPALIRRRRLAEALCGLVGHEFIVWLGGPGPLHELYPKREIIAEELEERGFTVIVSEKYPYMKSAPWMEREQISISQLVMIIDITAGPLCEAISFAAKYPQYLRKIIVFVPAEFEAQGGYPIQELKQTVQHIEFFSLHDFDRCSCDLGVDLWNYAEGARIVDFGDRKLLDIGRARRVESL